MCYAFIKKGACIGVGQARMLNEDIQNIEIDQYFFDDYRENEDKYIYQDGEFVLDPEFGNKKSAKELAEAKQYRAEAVNQITVEVDGMLFDGDEVSQERMSRSIVALDDGETIIWVLHDNSIANVTKEQLKMALRLAGQKQTELWTKPYENVSA